MSKLEENYMKFNWKISQWDSNSICGSLSTNTSLFFFKNMKELQVLMFFHKLDQTFM